MLRSIITLTSSTFATLNTPKRKYPTPSSSKINLQNLESTSQNFFKLNSFFASNLLDPRIDISGLPREKVVLALLDNVYNKSIISQTYINILTKLCYAHSHKKQPLSEEDIKLMLEAKQFKIDYIGTIVLKIDFTDAIIDTHIYDTIHKTDCTPGVLTAKECINNLRQNLLGDKKYKI